LLGIQHCSRLNICKVSRQFGSQLASSSAQLIENKRPDLVFLFVKAPDAFFIASCVSRPFTKRKKGENNSLVLHLRWASPSQQGQVLSAPAPSDAVAAGAAIYSLCRDWSVSPWPGSGQFCQYE
jgi:hypothetical protein